MKTVWAIVLMVGLYVGAALANEWLLQATEYGKGVHWVYVPAGLRLCFALVLPWAGPLAVALGSFFMALRDPELSLLQAALNGLVSGLAPLIARQVAVSYLGLKPDLRELDVKLLLKMCALFGLFSSTLHQSFFAWLGRDAGLNAGAIPMLIGDTLGAVLCLYLLRALIVRLGRLG
jgi:hypothetical protein